MKFAIKTLVAAAVIVAGGAANATLQTGAVGQAINVPNAGGTDKTIELKLLGGSGTLTFSNGDYDPAVGGDSIGGLIGALNVGKVKIVGIDGATYVESFTNPDLDPNGEVFRSGGADTASITSVTADDETGKVFTVASFGGAKQTGSRISGTLNGGSVEVRNLRFDLDQNRAPTPPQPPTSRLSTTSPTTRPSGPLAPSLAPL
jgi:hypothetical protein